MSNTKQTNVWIVTVAIFIATFMTAIEGTIVSTAMPTIIGNLHGMRLMNWVFSIYLLTNAMATPIYGKLADRIGRKPLFILGLFIFVIGSSMCGFSQNMESLIISRAVQGVGAGAIMPISYTIIADIYPFEQRAKVLGYNGSAWGIASVIAPLLGGFIVEKLTWHWIFFINVPIGLITITLIWYFLKEPKRTSHAPIDYWGSLWLMLTLLFVLYAFQLMGNEAINWTMVIILMLLACLMGYLFIRTEQKAKDPIIPLSLFKNRTFDVQNMVAFLVSGFLIGFEAYMPMWMQGILGLPASMGGFAVTPSSVMWVVGAFLSGVLLVKYLPRTIMIWSLLDLIAGAFVLAIVPINTPFWMFLIIAAFLGIGFGLTITITTVTSQNIVSPKEVGVASSFNTLSRTLGQTLMVSVYGIIINQQLSAGVKSHPGTTINMMNKLINPQTAQSLPHHLIPTLRTILYDALHLVYWASIVLLVGALIIDLFDSRKKPEHES